MTHQLIAEALFQEVLLNQIEDPRNTKLLVVAGYATPVMASRLLTEFSTRKRDISIELVVGMVGAEGIRQDYHDGFLQLQETHRGKLRVSYTTQNRSIHHKLYIWMREDIPALAFMGSSNFTQSGFLINPNRPYHGEILTETAPMAAYQEFSRIESASVVSTFVGIEEEILIYSETNAPQRHVAVFDENLNEDSLEGFESVILSLVALTNSGASKKGHPHDRWGLNWGQRANRDRNQANIIIAKRVHKDSPGFFPAGRAHNRPQFQITTDDQKSLFCILAEDGNKSLQSVPSNSLMGEYFRSRLGVASGERVTIDDLRRFGTRFVKIYKTEEDHFHMVFDPSNEAQGCAYYGLEPLW